ncbi:MAG: type II secretion system protein [Planctomycetota bacterium]|nr:type II secretion system protein [Planctomycetota bacterium]
MPLPRRAFTLIEMLITIGLIFLLATLIIVALRGVRGSANRVASANALRQMCLAYNSYCTDNQQQLMPGYLSAEKLRQLGIDPDTPTGVPFSTVSPWDDPPCDASSYVWRLAPYLDYEWRTMFADYRAPNLVAKLAKEATNKTEGGDFEPVYGPGTAAWDGSDGVPEELGISLTPSFGLNSVFVGGDDVHGGDLLTDYNPWDNPGNKIAATRFSEVRNPSTLVLFAPGVHFDDQNLFPDNPLPLAEFRYGYVELRPPITPDPEDPDGPPLEHWRIEENEVVIGAAGDFSATDAKGRPIGGGWPIARWDQSRLPVGHLDGSVTTEDINTLAVDWPRWSPWETGYDR